MNLNEFREQLGNPISDPETIVIIMRSIYNMRVEDLYCNGIWKNENPLKKEYNRIGVSEEKNEPVYSEIVESIKVTDKKRNVSPVVIEWVDELIWWLSYGSYGFVPFKYVKNTNQGGLK